MTQPFLKWAGGKRWLTASRIFARVPTFSRYIEPFLGGGAVYFHLKPTRAIISDINAELINLYNVVKFHPSNLNDILRLHQRRHCVEYFYDVRSTEFDDIIERAARTLYLNRTCWNGLYRVNRNGYFNVPIGTKNKIIVDDDEIINASTLLSRADIIESDFESQIDLATEGDLLFVDPPYTVSHNNNGFIKYNDILFTWSDQIRLRDALVRAADRGAFIIATNADHTSVQDLYDDAFHYTKLPRSSVISGFSHGRSATSEALFVANISV